MKIIFASKNVGKIAEVKGILASDKIELVSFLDLPEMPDVDEDGETFLENSMKKAKEIFDKYKIPAIADDSGLIVDQLGGEPGVYSARYAGVDATYDDNNKKLLEALINFNQPHYARFMCCAVYYDGAKFISAEGTINGEIVKIPRGTMGFGYDPVFMPQGYNHTLAEIHVEDKNKISHRANAFNLLREKMKIEGIL